MALLRGSLKGTLKAGVRFDQIWVTRCGVCRPLGVLGSLLVSGLNFDSRSRLQGTRHTVQGAASPRPPSWKVVQEGGRHPDRKAVLRVRARLEGRRPRCVRGWAWFCRDFGSSSGLAAFCLLR